jgi:hypothetical protein
MRLAPTTRYLVTALNRAHQTPNVLSISQGQQLTRRIYQPSIPSSATRGNTVGSHTFGVRFISHEQTARDLNQQGVDEALSDFDNAVEEEKDKQTRAPWHRQGADTPPVRRQRSAGAMTKGRLFCAQDHADIY